MNQLAFNPNPRVQARQVNQQLNPQLVDAAVPPPCEDSKQAFLSAMSRRVSSVNLVSTDGVAGRCGLTVTSMCSVSAEPPLVMIGINRGSPMCQAISSNGCFIINVLSVAQKLLADSFAGVGSESQRYDFLQASWLKGVTQAPVLIDAAASFECELSSYQDVGSHRMFLGQVVHTYQGTAAALCYSERRYKQAHAIQIN